MRNIESRLQIYCVKWFRLQYPKLARLLFAIPNGGYRNAATASRLKAEGVVPGVSDLLLLKASGNYHGLCIEMKTEKGRQSDSQKEFQKGVTDEGYRYELVRSFAQFKDLIDEYLRGT